MTNVIGGASAAHCPDDAGADTQRTVLATIADAIRAGTRIVVDLLERIVHGIRCVGPLVLGLGCQSTNEPVDVAPPASETAPAPREPAPSDEPRSLGRFTITFYYVVGEDDMPAVPANQNRRVGGESELAAVIPASPDLVTLYAGGGACEPIADVSKEFAAQLALQGTGKLHDGRVLNIWGACKCSHTPCFKVTPFPWGTAGSGRPLQPFRTVAVDPKVVKLGSLLYVPLLEGRTMPGRQPWGGYVHDGCVVADDTGGHITGNRLDLFVGRRGYYLGMSGSGGRHAWARHVPVFDGAAFCERNGRRIVRKAASI
jgi:3D (Asp-Asp-Asp) domain-containing protein